MTQTTRRDALKAGAAMAATAMASQFAPVHAAETGGKLKIGIIGCGGRGTGAVDDSFKAGPDTILWAAGDVFINQAKGLVNNSKKGHADRVDVGERIFGGLDAYQQVIDSGCDIILLASSPGFRPFHLEAAIKAKKHVFCEKPVAVDGFGIKKVLAAAEQAKKDGLSVVAGTQRRHQLEYLRAMEMIHGGAIGDIVAARCSWNGSEPWFKTRKPKQSDVEYQLYNWYHFNWVCGDHITEQHVHNLDVINWAMKGHPLKAVGQGGRIGRKDGDPKDVGNIYDLFNIEYEYAGGVPMYSYCSHVPGTTQDISEMVIGNKGVAKLRDARNGCIVGGKNAHEFKQGQIGPYVQEHIDLIKSIKDNKPLNELKAVAESTMTAIMGRMAVYSGKTVKWEDALNSASTMPKDLKLDQELAVAPVPRPGV